MTLSGSGVVRPVEGPESSDFDEGSEDVSVEKLGMGEGGAEEAGSELLSL